MAKKKRLSTVDQFVIHTGMYVFKNILFNARMTVTVPKPPKVKEPETIDIECEVIDNPKPQHNETRDK